MTFDEVIVHARCVDECPCTLRDAGSGAERGDVVRQHVADIGASPVASIVCRPGCAMIVSVTQAQSPTRMGYCVIGRPGPVDPTGV